MRRLFRDCPEAIEETVRFRERIDVQALRPQNAIIRTSRCRRGRPPSVTCADLTWEGAAKRYPDGIPDKVHDDAGARELAIIDVLGRTMRTHFLTVRDMVAYANEKKILCQGRGSAANSAVCYAIGITAADPTEIT